MKILIAMFLSTVLLLFVACGGEGPATAPSAIPTDPPDLGATVQAAVARALPTETPTPQPDIEATVAAGIAATRAAEPTPTPTPEPTPDLNATVEARMAATIAAMPTPTHTPTPTATPVPTPTPTATPTPVPTATPTPVPTATRRPTSTPTPTRTPIPTLSPSAALSEMVKRVRPAVVRIDSRFASGSGAIFETQGRTGYVITNHHVVEGVAEVDVTVNDSTPYRGKVLGTDPVRDLAVVSICCGSFRTLSFGDASRLEAGDEVVAIGYALGLSGEASITRGIVSAIRYDSNHMSDVIQTDAAINPGNSGGPMLSMTGQIVGINTFRIDESEGGRVAEGLGFAVSVKTVQQRLSVLKAGSPRPTPLPTRPPRPTPATVGGYGFGPIDGELQHEPSVDLIKTFYAGVDLSDMIVSATFVNPYSASSGSWDYGFIFRDTDATSDARFFQVVATSKGRWELAWRQGRGLDNQHIASGRIGRFDTTEGGENTLWLAAIGDSGLLFVNGEFMETLDLSAISGRGDIAAITGAYEGDERAGSVTKFQDFTVAPLSMGYGPASGSLLKDPEFISEHDSGLWTRDLIAEVTFSSPRDRNWDYGFVIRNPESMRLEVIGITGAGMWFHETRDSQEPEYTTVSDGFLRGTGASLQTRNYLLLIAIDDIGLFFVNGQLVARLDLSHNLDYGGMAVMAHFFRDHQGSPVFTDFNVWIP